MIELPTEAEPVTIFHSDSLEVMPTFAPDEPVYVLTDPPYGIGLTSHGGLFRSMEPIAGDESQEAGEWVIGRCAEWRGWPVLAFANPLKPWRGDWRQALAWDKGLAVGIGGDRRTCWKQTWELIQVGRFPEVFGNRDGSVLRFPMMPADSAQHPAAKSLDLMRYLVRKLVPPGALVFDPFAGIGTTGLASLLEGRRAVLVEKSGRYVEISRRRIREAMGRGVGSIFAEAECSGS